MIDSFSGRFDFLSNFYPCVVVLDGVHYKTVEHAYQAAKTLNPLWRDKIRQANSAGKARRIGKYLMPKEFVRPDWYDQMLPTMEALLRQKFSKPNFQVWLRDTYPHELVEGNTWNDVFWGVCDGVGQNHLGRLLMKIREELTSAYL
jgi:ribA/ribD-fused uncharacterized protein